MTNDQFFLFPILSYGNKNTVGAVARLFFSDPPLTPHANTRLEVLLKHRWKVDRKTFFSLNILDQTLYYIIEKYVTNANRTDIF